MWLGVGGKVIDEVEYTAGHDRERRIYEASTVR
jgi:hypothetical protein